MKVYDYLIVGGGIFGVYAAIYLSRKGRQVLLLEKESELLKKASIINQARLHAGYHYPRSIATARIADEHKERFIQEHKQFINFNFEQYYATDKYGSFTNGSQFKRFCNFLNIRAEKVTKHALFNLNRIESLYLTEEYSFDPVLIAEYYKELLKAQTNVLVKMNCTIIEAYHDNDRWYVRFGEKEPADCDWIQAYAVINATYSGTNTVNRLCNVKTLKLVHEITEMAMVSSPCLKHIGLTIMDGQFCSIMPYGLSGLLSLSSVTYTHHKESYEDNPTFDCQNINKDCRPNYYSICNECFAKPASNHYKMICQMKNYLADDIDLDYVSSQYTIKTKLQSSYIDDGRPTEISVLCDAPRYYCLFAGKINSIYEIESQVSNA